MKKIITSIMLIFAIVLLLHVGLFVFINTKGKDIVTKGLKDNFGTEASIGSMTVKFPLSVLVKKFDCGDVSFERAQVFLGFFNPLSSKLTLSQVFVDGLKVKVAVEGNQAYVNPFLKRLDEQAKIQASSDPSSGSTTVTIPAVKIDKSPANKISVVIRKLFLNGANLNIDYLIKRKTVTFVLSDINLMLKDIRYPELSKFYVDLSANLVLPVGEPSKTVSKIALGGWADFPNKNMVMSLNVSKFDYLAFASYYPNSWKPDVLGIEEAYISLDSNITSEDNDLLIDSLLTLEGVRFAELTEEEGSSRKRLTRTIIALLQGDNKKAALNFKIKTKMNSPKLDFSSVKDNVKDIMRVNPIATIGAIVDKVHEDIIERVENTGETTVDAIVDTVKEAIGSFSDMLKIQEEE